MKPYSCPANPSPLVMHKSSTSTLFFFSLSIEDMSMKQSFLLNIHPRNIVFQMENKRAYMIGDLYPVLNSLLGRTGWESFC